MHEAGKAEWGKRRARWVAAALTALAALTVLSCDEADERGAATGTRIFLTADPNPVHLVVDPTGSTTVTATVTNLSNTGIALQTVDFTVINGPHIPTMDTGSTDPMGQVIRMFAHPGPTNDDSTIRATTGTLSTSLNVFVLSEPADTLTLTPSSAVITTCSATPTGHFSLGGTLSDTANVVIKNAVITLTVLSSTPVPLTGCFGVDPAMLDCDEGGPVIKTNSFGNYFATFTFTEADCINNCASPNIADCALTLRTSFGTLNSTTDLSVTETVP